MLILETVIPQLRGEVVLEPDEENSPENTVRINYTYKVKGWFCYS